MPWQPWWIINTCIATVESWILPCQPRWITYNATSDVSNNTMATMVIHERCHGNRTKPQLKTHVPSQNRWRSTPCPRSGCAGTLSWHTWSWSPAFPVHWPSQSHGKSNGQASPAWSADHRGVSDSTETAVGHYFKHAINQFRGMDE